jgi:Ca2+/H+ antiporter, TMEM165/GDT1 family
MNLVLVAAVTFLAAGVEWVEALTIVLAVGLFKGWRSAFLGMVLAALTLVGLVLIFGVALAAIIPIAIARTLVGVFLLLFGLKWLHKAILRSSGLKALHDEAEVFETEKRYLLEHGGVVKDKIDPVGTLTSFNGVFLEGLEVVFIVIALGGTSLSGAILGSLLSAVVVAIVGVMFRAPLTRVPENTMKYVVGIMLTSFGTFFAGEGVGVEWWRADLSILWLIAVYAIGSIVLVQILKRPPQIRLQPPAGVTRAVRTVASEAWGLFVGDSALALVVVVALLAIALYANTQHQSQVASYLLVVGVVASVVVGVIEPYRKRTRELHAAARARQAPETTVGSGAVGASEAQPTSSRS